MYFYILYPTDPSSFLESVWSMIWVVKYLLMCMIQRYNIDIYIYI